MGVSLAAPPRTCSIYAEAPQMFGSLKKIRRNYALRRSERRTLSALDLMGCRCLSRCTSCSLCLYFVQLQRRTSKRGAGHGWRNVKRCAARPAHFWLILEDRALIMQPEACQVSERQLQSMSRTSADSMRSTTSKISRANDRKDAEERSGEDPGRRAQQRRKLVVLL